MTDLATAIQWHWREFRNGNFEFGIDPVELFLRLLMFGLMGALIWAIIRDKQKARDQNEDSE